MQNPVYDGRILLDSDFGGFALYNCDPRDRLNIRINKPGEKILFGFGTSYNFDALEQYVANDVSYRIIDPDGEIVVNSAMQALSGPGFIGYYQQAVAGPNIFDPQGYDPLVVVCNKTGDYFVEFDHPDIIYGGRRELKYFDITVAGTDNKAVPGRVWSKAWMFSVSTKGGDPYDNPFYGKLFILTDDGIVTSVDFNGMKPYVFTLSANGTGVQNSGNPVADRKSVLFKSTYPQYKVFLNDPDQDVFPSGSFGLLTAPTQITGTEPPYCINVNTSQAGAVEVLINFNGIPGYQAGTRDVLIAKNVESGTSCIEWNGKDGFGKVIEQCSNPIGFYITFIGGLTHMPIYDVETNTNGFIIELVRPKNAESHLALYWDDSNIPGYSTPPSEGCDGTLGCHEFGYFFGDEHTINTWWYSTSKITDSLTLFSVGVSLDSVLVKEQKCSNVQDGLIEVFIGGGTPPYTYSLDGDNFQPSPVFQKLAKGNYILTVRDKNNCEKKQAVNVKLSTLISADFEAETGDVYNLVDFFYQGDGANFYQWDFGDGFVSGIENPSHQYTVDSVYYVQLITGSGPPDYCSDSMTKMIEVYPELQIYAPTAFSPNNDQLNDTFKLFGVGLYGFQVYIFSSGGTQIFYSDNNIPGTVTILLKNVNQVFIPTLLLPKTGKG
ncbi:MAG: PKD domain-containing protein [Bacteroidales bacterium]|nr:PKD domain-containing protein [Bacteroidales bacterium]